MNMKIKSSLGEQILAAIREAIESPVPAGLRRPKAKVKAIRKNHKVIEKLSKKVDS